MLILETFKETFQGKTLSRILLNQAIRQMNLCTTGTIVDLGSGAGRASYFRFITCERKTQIVSIDINPKRKPTIKADISQKISLPSNSVDLALFINAIYLMPDPERVLHECSRILKPEAKLLVNFPLIWSINDEPKDYWRFTNNAVDYVLERSGFNTIKASFYGGTVSSAFNLFDPYLPVWSRFFLHPLAVFGDWLFSRLVHNPAPCPIGIIVLAQKNDRKVL